MTRELIDIIIDYRNGNQDALLEIIKHKYVKAIIDAAYNKQGSNKVLEKEELVNEVYMQLYRRLKTFTPRTSKEATSYLNQVIKGHVINLLNKHTKINNSQYLTDTNEDNLLNSYEDKYDLYNLSKYIDNSPLLIKRFREDKTLQEIADELNISKSHAMKLVDIEVEEVKKAIGIQNLSLSC